ncbi:MAG: Gfo/Idh/MocA family oxidoreductase, partial [Bifidobacteriaceae bacterium]|nr:Gfo/Idh/MocA family oxidoreductase [Bifidobacteriaceae bacterium]
MANLRAGVIGIGSMGRHHVRILRQLEGVDLVAVADPGGDRFGAAGDLPVGQTVEDLIAARLDMAVVAVPTVLHEEVGLALAEAKVPTMLEKPVAASAAAARRVADAFAAAGVVACVGHVERFNPAIAGLRARIGQGELGEIYQVATRRQGPFPARISDVGVVKDLATHDINSSQWLAGSAYAEVSAQVTHRALREHEDMVVITARMANGVLANHIVNWLSPMKERLTIVTGERGAFVADTGNVTLTFWANGSVPTEWEPLRQ